MSVQRWNLLAPNKSQSNSGLPVRGLRLAKETGPGGKFQLANPKLPDQPDQYPMVRGMDAHALKGNTFVCGTDGCDIWEVDATPRTILDGHTETVFMAAVHPQHAHLFATADESGCVSQWNTNTRQIERSAMLGFKCYAIDISSAYLLALQALLSPALSLGCEWHLPTLQALVQ